MMLRGLDVQLILNSCLMWWGVPFVRSAKPKIALSDHELDTLRAKLHACRRSLTTPEESAGEAWNKYLASTSAIEMSSKETRCMIEIIEAVLAETAGDPMELHAHVGPREQLELTLEKLAQAERS